MKNRLLKLISVLTLVTCSQAWADWQLDNSSSRLYFISSKNTHITETHRFEKLSGTLADNGKLKISIPLSSINTGIEIRDTRMKEKLFNLADFANAEIRAKLDSKVLQGATSKFVTVPFILKLNGKQKSLQVAIHLQKTANSLIVNSVKPVVINANDYALALGIDALKTLAGLSNISYAVPVSFHLSFSRLN